jgi:hypothetical protein
MYLINKYIYIYIYKIKPFIQNNMLRIFIIFIITNFIIDLDQWHFPQLNSEIFYYLFCINFYDIVCSDQINDWDDD